MTASKFFVDLEGNIGNIVVEGTISDPPARDGTFAFIAHARLALCRRDHQHIGAIRPVAIEDKVPIGFPPMARRPLNPQRVSPVL
jgi:hypothetical protein